MSTRWAQRLLPLEFLLIRWTSFLHKVPLVRRLHRKVTAQLVLIGDGTRAVNAFRVNFETPYLRLPVEVDRSQIGMEKGDSGIRPAAFRFFDWQSWVHIEGAIVWHGERESTVNGRPVNLITGFTYRPDDLSPVVGNLGLRIAEGVEGTVRVLWGEAIVTVGFEPGYWMLESGNNGYRIVPIRDNDLMVLIVSLSEIGTGNSETYAGAVEHLWQWVNFHFGQQGPEPTMLMLLKYVRDWGPLGMLPLYGGLVEVLERLRVPDKESILFESYADHWGVRDNRNGRLLAVRTLEALGTDVSRSALREILIYVRNRGLEPEELSLIQAATGEVGQTVGRGVRGAHHSPVLPPHPTNAT